MSDNQQQQRFCVKIFKGNQNEVTKNGNELLSEMQKRKFILKDTQFLFYEDSYLVLFLFEYNHLKLHFPSKLPPQCSILSEKNISNLKNLEDRINSKIQEKQNKHYYPTHSRFELQLKSGNSKDEISVLFIFEHSNLMQDFS